MTIHQIIEAHPRTFIMTRKARQSKPCPVCGSVFEITPKRRTVCSQPCAGKKVSKLGGDASGAKRRGQNPDRHIRMRLPDGRRVYLHRHLMSQYLKRELLPHPEEIVHHVDGNKHHNCLPGDIQCGSLFCNGNLELLTGDAAKEHWKRHYDESTGKLRSSPREEYKFDNEDGLGAW